MNRFAALLDRLAFEPRRNGKLALIGAYLRDTPDPERGYALAALTGGLTFREAKPGLVRALIAERVDPALFALSYDFVGDLSETVALLWPAPEGDEKVSPALSAVVTGLSCASRAELPGLLAGWLDGLDETGRWALLKLIAGGLRVGVSARLAKTAVAALGGRDPDAVEEVWHGLTPPYQALFDWLEGRGPAPTARDPAPFRPPMLAQPIEDRDFDALDPADFVAEWKWDGVRAQAASGLDAQGRRVARLWSRSGEELSQAFPDLIEALDFDGAIDGELLVRVEGRIGGFDALQRRLNRKSVSAKLLSESPAALRAYDLLAWNGEDLRALPFRERRARLEDFVARHGGGRIDLSPLLPFEDWEALARTRAGVDDPTIEGCMIKRRDGAYVPGRPVGQWYKWKRDPRLIDAVLMYAQRGHGKRSSFYSDFTFGVWREEAGGRRLTPVGKAYFGFTDAELVELDRYVRRNTVDRFGPVRVVGHGEEAGLVLEVAFEGLRRSTRHKSGVAMRFPRINRIRWDKPAREADALAALERMIDSAATSGSDVGS